MFYLFLNLKIENERPNTLKRASRINGAPFIFIS